VPTPTGAAAKKTLAQIQKEEEARKNRAAAAAAMAATPSPPIPSSTGKRYADLASKGPAPAAPAVPGSSAWTTVGASGKVKGAPTAPLGPRTSSGPVPISPVIAKPRPVTVSRAVTSGSNSQSNPNQAVEEFTKWATLSLSKGLNTGINGMFHSLITICEIHILTFHLQSTTSSNSFSSCPPKPRSSPIPSTPTLRP
jgi:PERQ amino acid-rich with GYF domain-containing protein